LTCNNYGEEIDEYQRYLESINSTHNCLVKHKITPALRARMVDWMIEVLTNFKCDDQTFFLSVSLLDRYFKHKQDTREVGDLHIIGVTSMFVASKYEDIYPLKMKMVYEKIAHKKLPIEKIKTLEMDVLKSINYKIAAPTSLDFLKAYLKQVLNIGKCGKSAAGAASSSSSEKEKKEESPP
jgi:Cyclin, N-terminal domain